MLIGFVFPGPHICAWFLCFSLREKMVAFFLNAFFTNNNQTLTRWEQFSCLPKPDSVTAYCHALIDLSTGIFFLSSFVCSLKFYLPNLFFYCNVFFCLLLCNLGVALMLCQMLQT